MSEATRRPLSETQDRKRLPSIVVEGRVYGHGAQLAVRRLHRRLISQAVSEAHVTRQQARRAGLKERKQEAAAAERRAAHEALLAMRAARRPTSLPKRHPGKTLVTPHILKQHRGDGAAHGQAYRRVLQKVEHTILIPFGGRLVERQYEESFHATKGRRIQRIA